MSIKTVAEDIIQKESAAQIVDDLREAIAGFNDKDAIKCKQDNNEYQKFYQFVCYNKRFTFYDRFYDDHNDARHQCIKNGDLSHSLLFL